MKWILTVAVAGFMATSSAIAQSRPQLIFPDIAGNAMESYRRGQLQAQHDRQANLDYQTQLEYMQGQQRLRELSAEFWASDDARKWQLLPQIAAIDPVLAGQYQASIAPLAEAPRSIVYKCPTPDGSIVFTGTPAEGCIVISANPGQ